MARKAGSRVRVAEGVYRDRYGLSGVVWVKGQRRIEQRFPLDTEINTILAWRLQTAADLLNGVAPAARRPTAAGTLAQDSEKFLAMLPEGGRKKSFAQLLAHWRRSPLADVPRAAITRLQIAEQLHAWEGEQLSASELNHRLRAIRAVYRELDGDDAPNPAARVKKRREPPREPRAVPIEFVEIILAHVPDRRHTRALTVADAQAITAAVHAGTRACELARHYGVSDTLIRKIARRRGDVAGWNQVSHSKIRLRVMAWTGMPQIQMERLRPQDLDLENARVHLRPRQKGRGAPGAWVRLIPPGLEALRDFAAANLFGRPFSRRSLARTWARAIDATLRDLGAQDPARLTQVLAVIPDGCRPYDLRHSFLTDAYRRTGDIRAVAEMAQHADLQTTKRYTEGAVSERVDAAIAKMSERWTQTPAPTPAAQAKPTGLLRLVRKPS